MEKYTGRMLVLMAPERLEEAMQTMSRVAGIRAVGLPAEASPELEDVLSVEGGAVLTELGIAVVSSDADQQIRLSSVAGAGGAILAQEPEQVVFALDDDSFVFPDEQVIAPAPDSPVPRGLPAGNLPAYAKGYGDGVARLVEALLAAQPSEMAATAAASEAFADGNASWGLVATRVTQSAFSGAGKRIAILDTGLDLTHPDFAGRAIAHQSFIPGEAVQDGHGHGTHCAGIALGGAATPGGMRYGAAQGADLLVGKVLSNGGSGADGGILAGIQWAMQQRADVVSMSLGSFVSPGGTFSPIYQAAATRALQRGTLLVAAAGNDSRRPQSVIPVGRPANCPSILGVGALDRFLSVARFSNGGVNPNGGEVNVAAPGVDVFSSWFMPVRYKSISGTSMATPLAAGALAMWGEATGLRGMALANRMLRASKRLPLAASDVGWGLLQAP